MTITRERQSHYSGWENHRRCDPRFGERPDAWIRNLYRKYAGRGRLKNMTRAEMPLSPFGGDDIIKGSSF